MRVQQVGLEQSMEEGFNKGARRIQRRPLKIGIDSRSFEQPLGRITGQLGEFQKSMDASVARVLAFGAAVSVMRCGALEGVGDFFDFDVYCCLAHEGILARLIKQSKQLERTKRSFFRFIF